MAGLFLLFFGSDLEIAQRQTPKDISEVASEIGLHPEEVSLIYLKFATLLSSL